MRMATHIDRRGFLVALPALALAPKIVAQGAKPQIKTRGINHVKLNVADLKRSIDFYQGLFGMPVQSRMGSTDAALRIGSGPQHLALSNDPTRRRRSRATASASTASTPIRSSRHS